MRSDMGIDSISRDFTWEEMCYSRVAVEKGILNDMPEPARKAMRELVKRLLQPLRIAYGGPIHITSGYRCPELNRLVGGVPSSQHVKGEAADCYVPDPARLVEILMIGELPFDQVIWYQDRNFVHVSLRNFGENRKQLMIRYK